MRKRQQALKEEFRRIKHLVGSSPEKWGFDLHVLDSMSINEPSIVEALEQETKILEKRLAACKSHLLMITVFDSNPRG